MTAYAIAVDLASGDRVDYLVSAPTDTKARHQVLPLLPAGATIIAVAEDAEPTPRRRAPRKR